MKKTNKVFLFVLLLLTGVVVITWQFIQTERFGALLNARVGEQVKKRYGVTASFERLDIGIFPLATRLVNLELEYENYYLNAGRFGLEFGLRDIFSDDFSIGKLSLSDALVYLPKPKIKGESKEGSFNLSDLFKIYTETINKKIPFLLRGVSVKNSIVNLESFEINAIDTELLFFPNILMARFSLGFDGEMFESLNVKEINHLKLNGATGEIQLSESNIRFRNFKIHSDNSYLDLSGKLKGADILQGMKVDSFIDFQKLKKIIPETEISQKILPKGYAKISGEFNGNYKSPEGNAVAVGTSLSSKLYKFSRLETSLSLKEDVISLESATGKIGGGELKVTQPTEVLNVKTLDFLWPDLFIEAKKLYTNDILFFLPKLDVAKAKLSGPVKLGIKPNKLLLRTFEGFTIDDFFLKSDTGKNILENPKLFLGAGSNVSVEYEGAVNFETAFIFKNSKLDLKGRVGNGGVNVSLMPGGVVDFDAFGPIAGLSLKGVGPASGSITGPFEDVSFRFNLAPNDFEMLGFKLGQISGQIGYDLKTALLNLENLAGSYKGINYSGGGNINFKKKDALDLSFVLKKASLLDSKEAFEPVLKPMFPYLKNTSFNYNAAFTMRGGLKVPELDVAGRITASNILIYSEDLEEVKGEFFLKSNKLSFKNIRAKKVAGNLTGEGEYDLTDKSYSYRGTLSNLRIKDLFYYRLLNLGLDGDTYGEFYGVGDEKVFSSRSHLRLTNSSIENARLNDSILTVYNNKKDLFFSTSVIGGELKGAGYVNLSSKKDKKSAFSFKVNSPNIRGLAGILGKHNILNQSLSGKVKGSFNTDFYIQDMTGINLTANLDKLSFDYPGIQIKNIKKPIEVKIENGEFTNWDYEILGEGVAIKSKGEGNINKKFSLKHDFKINSSLVELLTDNVEKSQGSVSGEHLIVGSLKNLDQYLKVRGEQLNFKAKGLPGLFSDFTFNVLMEDNVLLVKKALGTYGNGKVRGRGSVKFKFPFPEVDINLNVEKSRFPILKKSGVVVSGDLTLVGKKLPYNLNGSLAIIQGQVIDEMNDLASSAINSESYQRFIPVGYLEGSVSFINTDISLSSFSPIKIKNGMIDLGLGGNLRIFGSIFSPKFNGELLIENPENKFLFKGHEFVLSEGLVRFIDGARKESPELRFSGVARINDYDVYINLNGPADNMGVEMTSNPPLSQEDILSLLTLGVTSDVSRNLGDRQRQSVTTLSIGSLIMDQLKINQSLNDSLGLRLSIQPEFIEDENNLLEGRTEDRAGGNRFRSSTVLKVQKRISKKVNLSLSSTVGGSVDQSQEMNINYRINKSWSLEGVYEVRSNDELEQELPDSVGADVKYQWSF